MGASSYTKLKILKPVERPAALSKPIGTILIDGVAFTRYTGPEKYYTEEETRRCPLCGGKLDIQDETEISAAYTSPVRDKPAVYARLSVYECGAVVYYRRMGTILNVIAMRDHTLSPMTEEMNRDDSDII